MATEESVLALEKLNLDAISSDKHPPCADVHANESLVPVANSLRLATSPKYAGLAGHGYQLCLRESVIARLDEASRSLPQEFVLVLLDGWRSADLQRVVFEKTAAAAQSDRNRARTYAFDLDARSDEVSYPAEDAPHRTGGAVDVTLVGQDGLPWPMGTAFDDTTEYAATRAYEDVECKTIEHRAARVGRRLLYHAMIGAGFSNYPEEWWHYDFGNAFWRHFGKVGDGPVYRTIDA